MAFGELAIVHSVDEIEHGGSEHVPAEENQDVRGDRGNQPDAGRYAERRNHRIERYAVAARDFRMSPAKPDHREADDREGRERSDRGGVAEEVDVEEAAR